MIASRWWSQGGQALRPLPWGLPRHPTCCPVALQRTQCPSYDLCLPQDVKSPLSTAQHCTLAPAATCGGVAPPDHIICQRRETIAVPELVRDRFSEQVGGGGHPGEGRNCLHRAGWAPRGPEGQHAFLVGRPGCTRARPDSGIGTVEEPGLPSRQGARACSSAHLCTGPRLVLCGLGLGPA